MSRLERDFQSQLIRDLESLFPGCIVLKNDPNYRQGIPDLVILFNDRWALLEAKKSNKASSRPNQEWYVDKARSDSYGSFIYPENRDEVIEDLIRFFR